MGTVEKVCATIGAIVCILVAASKGTSGAELMVMGAIGGGIGAVVGGFVRVLKR
jgi:hypothetical protein